MRRWIRATFALLLFGLLLTGCSRPEKFIGSFEEAETARIGVMTGSTGEALVAARFPHAQVDRFDDIMDAVTAMKSGQLDAIVTAFPAALQVTKKIPEFTLLPDALSYENSAIAVRKGNDELLAAVNAILAELKADGTLEDMEARWFKRDLSPYEEPNIPVPTTGEVLKIGVSATREPFSFVDANGRVTGHDGELARIIGAKLNRPIEFFNMKFMALIPALQSGKVDLIVTGMTATDERRKSVDFSQTYYANAQRMIVRKPADDAQPKPAGGARTESADAEAHTARGPLRSPADLADKRIAVFLGSAHETYATANYPGATILQYKSPADVVLAVRTGKADAALFDAEPLRDIMRQDASLAILGEPLFSFPVAVGFASDNDELRQQFNRFLATIRANGVYDDMIRRWIELREETMPAIDNARTGSPLVVGVSDAGMPFTAVKDGRLVGFDIELAERFGASLGREVRLANMDFGSLIAAVASGKTDLIASAIYVTEEREKQIDFSDPYYHMATLMFALKSRLDTATADEPETERAPFYRKLKESFHNNIILENRYLLIWDGLKTTVFISILATLFGTLLGAMVCFMRMSTSAVLKLFARIYIAVLRGTPVLVLLMLIFYVVFASVNIDPVLVAVIAFGMNFAAYVSEMFRSGIEGIDHGQTEAGISLGFTPFSTFVYIVLPQALQRILPVYKGEFISLVKMTSIVGYIAVQDLTKASDIIRSRTFDAFFPLVMVAILYFTISWLLMQSLEYLEKVTDPKFKRARGRKT